MSSRNIGHLEALISGRHSASCQGFLTSVLSRSFHEILTTRLRIVIDSLDFEWLFLHMDNRQIMDKTYQTILSNSVFSRTPTLVELTQVLLLVMHSIAASRPRDEVIEAQLFIIASILQQSKAVLPVNSLDSLKELVFVRPGVLKDIMMTMPSSEIFQGNLNTLLSSPFPQSISFRRTFSVRSDS